MRYYVIAIQHNKDVNAENRSVPKAYDDKLTARQEFHRQLGVDINNATLDWGVVSILNSDGYLEATEKWERPIIVNEDNVDNNLDDSTEEPSEEDVEE